MKFFIFPENIEKIAPAVTGLDINRNENCITFYVNTHLQLSEFFKKSCAIKTVIEELSRYLYQKFRNFTFVKEIEEIHGRLHDNEADATAITHFHVKFQSPLTPELIKSFLNEMANYQRVYLSDGTQPILIPYINQMVVQINEKIRENFDSDHFDANEVKLNCIAKNKYFEQSKKEKKLSICPSSSSFYRFRNDHRYLAAQRNYTAISENDCKDINNNLTMLVGLGMAGMLVATIVIFVCLYNYFKKIDEQKQLRPENKPKKT